MVFAASFVIMRNWEPKYFDVEKSPRHTVQKKKGVLIYVLEFYLEEIYMYKLQTMYLYRNAQK